ncbi:helix-turn-helix domain-containing protein [Buttiauxella sp. WJP83]|uniref:helix-turn-helix domain-containing protein n=1 Tax=Buttiauxella sp. WJP83 TaxID=2986951 RepID=UPI0022DE5C53|nr:helix-turn-helix domain-containing protein [Buttiauxella sp. WJP83]WBM71938.1 helix-turn-helix domain-containing protein [Buttiauxella sp. WJP83]
MKEQVSNTFIKSYHKVMRTPCKGKITQNLKLVYCVLLGFQENAGKAFPSNQYIADEIGISKRAVIDNTAELERMGLIKKQRQYNNSNIYTVNEWGVEDTRGAMSSPPSEATSPPSAMSSPLEVQPTALYKNMDNTIHNIKDKIKEVIEEEGVEEMKPFESKATAYVKEKEIEMDSPSTVSFLSTVSQPVKADSVSSLTVVPEFRSGDEAYSYVRSMGSQIKEKDFNYIFGSTMKYEEPELNISIKRIYG